MVDAEQRRETREFFAPRAATWDERFPDDGPAFAAAVSALALRPGDVAVDLGCGTGRALPHLRAAVGPQGRVLGLDLTEEMVAVATANGPVAVGDATEVPVTAGRCAGVFAAGLLNHLPDAGAALVEWARLTGPDGRLALFHPIGRAALAARRGHELSPDDIRDPRHLPAVLAGTGWELVDLDDGDDRYLAVARRVNTARDDGDLVEPDADDILDNPEWFALAGEHAHLADVNGSARRYQPEVTIFGGLRFAPGRAAPDEQAWADLADLVGPAGWVVIKWICDPPPPPEGWTTVVALGGNQMVLRDPETLHAEDDRIAFPVGLTVRDLEPGDVPAMTDLVRRTDPGPFLPRTIEMGRYVGAFAGERLVAMAGERVHPPGHTEISAVCTDAEVRGQGLATSLVRVVADGIIERGETPYLNVAEGNDNARALYERLGFRLRRTIAFRSVRWR